MTGLQGSIQGALGLEGTSPSQDPGQGRRAREVNTG